MPESFVLHKRLAEDSRLLGCFPLSQVRLILDANYPWFILVPQRHAIEEIYQLSGRDQQQLLLESSLLSSELSHRFNADKMNIAAIGNMVPQLHLHHIVRYKNDAVWPAPVWGEITAKTYCDETLNAVLDKFSQCRLSTFTPV